MAEFRRKKLKKVKRICLRLRDARIASGLTVEQIAEKTRIEKKYILALESCDFDKLPAGDIYRKQFIRLYLRAIGVEAETYLLQYTTEEGTREKVNVHPHRNVAKRYFQNTPALVRVSGVAVIALIMVSYLGLQVKRIIDPPHLVIHNPGNGVVMTEPNLMVEGTTDREVFVSINGTEVAQKTDGQFSEEIDLAPGLNSITISAKRKHGKTTTEVRHVIYRTDRTITRVDQPTQL